MGSVAKLRSVFGNRLLNNDQNLKAKQGAGQPAWATHALAETPNEQLQILVDVAAEAGLYKNALPALQAMDLEKFAAADPQQAARLTQLKETFSNRQSTTGRRPFRNNGIRSEWERGPCPPNIQHIAQTVVTGGPEFVGWQMVSEFQNPGALHNPQGQLRRYPAGNH